MALTTDAFQQDRSTEGHYKFPPFCLIMRCPAKLRAEGGELILVSPVWPTQAWCTHCCTCQLPRQCFLYEPLCFFVVRRGNRTLQLSTNPATSSRVPCVRLQRKEFQKTLPSSAWRPGTNNSAWSMLVCREGN